MDFSGSTDWLNLIVWRKPKSDQAETKALNERRGLKTLKFSYKLKWLSYLSRIPEHILLKK